MLWDVYSDLAQGEVRVHAWPRAKSPNTAQVAPAFELQSGQPLIWEMQETSAYAQGTSTDSIVVVVVCPEQATPQSNQPTSSNQARASP